MGFADDFDEPASARIDAFLTYFAGLSPNSALQPEQQSGYVFPSNVTFIVAAPPVTTHLGRSAADDPAANASPSFVRPTSIVFLYCGAPGSFWATVTE